MSAIKISSLQEATTLSNGALDYILLVVDNGISLENKKIKLSNLFSNIKAPFIVNPENGAIDFSVNSQSANNLIKTFSTTNRIGVNIGNNTPDSTFHIIGDLTIGSNSLNLAGNIVNSREVLNITTNSEITSQDINNSYSVTVLKTVAGSKTTMSFNMSAPAKDGLYKTVIYGEKDASISSSVSFNISTINVLGATIISLSKLGNSVTFYSHNGKWLISSYNGASIV